MPIQSRSWSIYRAAAIILGIATVLWLISYCAAVGTVNPAHAAADEVGATAAGVENIARLHGAQEMIREHLEQLSEHDIKLFYVRCSQEVLDRRLDGGEAMACSIGYDILLKKHFAGDFEQLLLWSRATSAAGR
jgi:hypothetical protein